MHIYLPKVDSDRTLQLIKAYVHETCDGVRIIEAQRVLLALVPLGLGEMVLQLFKHKMKEVIHVPGGCLGEVGATHYVTQLAKLSPSLIFQTKSKC